MFERFTDDARQVVVLASEITRERGDRTIVAVHMLAGLAAAAEPTVIAAGLSRERVEQLWDAVPAGTSVADGLDSEALAGIGIDVEAIRQATDRSFGRGPLDRIRRRQLRPSTGHLPFSADLKKAVGLSLSHAVSTSSRDITPTHLLLGLLDVEDTDLLAVLRAAEVTTDSLRAAAVESLDTPTTPAPTEAMVQAGLDHVSLQVADLDAAVTFYDAALAPLGVRQLMRHDDIVGFGSDGRSSGWRKPPPTDPPASSTSPSRQPIEGPSTRSATPQPGPARKSCTSRGSSANTTRPTSRHLSGTPTGTTSRRSATSPLLAEVTHPPTLLR